MMEYMDSRAILAIEVLLGLLAVVIALLVAKYVIAAGVREGMRKARADERKEATRIAGTGGGAKAGQ